LEAINDRLTELSKIEPKEITQEEVDEIQTLADEVKQLADDIAAMPIDLAAGAAAPAKGPINLTLSSNPSNLAGLIKKRVEHITATRPGAPPATLGVYAGLSGTTTFIGTLTLNGSYGTATLYGTAGGVSSNVVTITVKGQTKQDAEKELQALLDKLTDEENRLVTLFSALSATMASLTTLLVALTASALGAPLGLALVVVGAVAALGYAIYAMSQIEIIHQRFRQLRRDAEDAARPLINSLPSTR